MRHRLDRLVLAAGLLVAVVVPASAGGRGPGDPHPPARPGARINGAKVFGVRPGSPFLFTIPATGERPLRYEARGLPAGLRLDPATGRITGRLDRAGKHEVVFEVSNRHGTARRPFRIACGDTLALTPHMGWNSWYVWENNVTDRIIRDAADAMARSGMIDHGYMYVNIDDCWAVKPGAPDAEMGGPPRDAEGRVRPNRRFPDMKALTDHIHALGLKAGIYTSPGPITCGGHVGAYQHEEQDVAQFVAWGFDFLKYDWCSYGQVAPKPDRAALEKPYRLIGEILKRQPRDVVLNLCQYGMGDVWEWGKAAGGQSWRTAGDFGLTFEGIPAALFRDGFDLYAKKELHRFGGPGGWNDPDYLLLGYLSNWKGKTVPTPLSPDEQYAHVSLWCLLAAPLIFSGDITRLDDFTLGLLDQRRGHRGGPGSARPARASRGEGRGAGGLGQGHGRRLARRGPVQPRRGGGGRRGEWSDLGLSGPRTVRDLWRQKDLGKFDGEFKAHVPRHGVVLVRVAPIP